MNEIRHSDPKNAAKLVKRGYQGSPAFSDEWRWKFRVRHAEILLESGSLKEAESETTKLQNLPIPPGIPPLEASARVASLLGYLQFQKENYDGAEPLFESAAAGLFSVAHDPCWQAELLVHHRAQNFRSLGKFSRAEESLQQGMEAAQACGDERWATLIPYVRGNCFNDQFRFENAVNAFQQSLDRARANNDKPLITRSMGTMGLCYYNLGDTDNALQRFNQTDAYYRSQPAPLSTVDLQAWGADIGHRARTSFLLKRYDEAERFYTRAIEIAKQTDDGEYLPRWQAELTSLYIEEADYPSAQQLNQQVLAAKNADPAALEIAHLNEARIDRRQGHLKEAAKSLDDLQNGKKITPGIAWQIHIERAQVLADMKRIPQALREFELALNTAGKARELIGVPDYRLTYFVQLQNIYEKYVHFLMAEGKSTEALRVADSGHARILAEKVPPRKSTPQSSNDFTNVARANHATILSYSITASDSYVWLTNAQGTKPFKLPANASLAELQSLIADHNSKMQAPGTIDDDQSGRDLYERLLGQVEHLIPPESNVIVIPDGPLANLNFETLIRPGDKPRFWLESVVISVAPSLTLLSTVPEAARKPKSILLVGDAIQADPELPALGDDDLHYINSLYPFSDQITREHATPAGFLETVRAKPYSWIHVSAHAISDPLSPLDSYIVLSPQRGGNYKLSAREISDLGLKADLVTLSACQSAGRKIVPGEGLVGLSWAVLNAGARNVVASLWNVDAEATTRLMKKFYRHLHVEPDSPARAFRSAKLDLIQAKELPLTWAAFQIYSR